VRALRRRQAPLRHLTARCNDEYLSEKRSAVTNCTTGSGLLRDVGKNPAAMHLKELEDKIKRERQRLREESTASRKSLVASKKELLAQVKTLTLDIKALTSALQKAIAESEKRLRTKGEGQ
jgi:cell division septum initiation protein DivIVA